MMEDKNLIDVLIFTKPLGKNIRSAPIIRWYLNNSSLSSKWDSPPIERNLNGTGRLCRPSRIHPST
jgi:hypothetical protein